MPGESGCTVPGNTPGRWALADSIECYLRFLVWYKCPVCFRMVHHKQLAKKQKLRQEYKSKISSFLFLLHLQQKRYIRRHMRNVRQSDLRVNLVRVIPRGQDVAEHGLMEIGRAHV